MDVVTMFVTHLEFFTLINSTAAGRNEWTDPTPTYLLLMYLFYRLNRIDDCRLDALSKDVSSESVKLVGSDFGIRLVAFMMFLYAFKLMRLRTLVSKIARFFLVSERAQIGPVTKFGRRQSLP